MNSTPSACVLGAGIAGLTTALTLQRHGWQVRLLEQHDRVGGMLQCFRRGPCQFDSGFHFVTGSGPDGPYRRIAEFLGIDQRLHWAPLNTSNQFAIHGGDLMGDFACPVGLDASREALCRAFPQSAAAIGDFYRRMHGQLARGPWLRCLAEPDIDPGPLDKRPVGEVMQEVGLSGRLAEILGALSGILGLRASEMSMETFSLVCGSALSGSYRLHSGGDGLTQPLAEAFVEAGGVLQLGCDISRIESEERVCTGFVTASGDRVQADTYIATCDPRHVIALAGPRAFRKSFHDLLDETPDSTGVFWIHATLDALPEGQERFAHHLLRTEDGTDVYLAFPSVTDGGPPRMEVLAWDSTEDVDEWRGSHYGKRPETYKAWKAARSEKLLDRIAEIFPDIRDKIRRNYLGSSLTLEHYTRSHRGAALGMSHSYEHLGNHLPSPRGRLRNLFFCGHNFSHPGVLGTSIGALELCSGMLGFKISERIASPLAV